LVRFLGLTLAVLPLFAGFLLILVDDRRRGLHDVVVELGCAVVLTDPALRRRIAHLCRHAARGRRAGLASASHHLDVPPLGLVDPAARVVAPRGGARALRRSGREVVAVAAGELLALAGVRVRVVPALHDGRRRR
jgi:L-ascorbate metabolism protein UlaG (beta-lactamase superfamily)